MSLYRLRGNRGSVLIAALWALFTLAMLAFAIDGYVRPQVTAAGKLKYRAKLFYIAKAGVKRAIAEILENDTSSHDALNDTWSSNEGVFKDAAVGDGSFSVAYETSDYGWPAEGAQDLRYGLIDEERKININKSSYAVLVNFFEIAGNCNPQNAAEIADSIIDWRDVDEIQQPNGAESAYYFLMQPSYSSKNGDFQVLDELLLVKGITPEIFDSVKRRITLYGTGAVNINTADVIVLQSIGMSDVLAGKVISFRKGADAIEATEDDGIFDSISTVADKLDDAVGLTGEERLQLNDILAAGSISVASNNFMGYSIAKIHGENKPMTVTFVFDRDKAIKYWREN